MIPLLHTVRCFCAISVFRVDRRSCVWLAEKEEKRENTRGTRGPTYICANVRILAARTDVRSRRTYRDAMELYNYSKVQTRFRICQMNILWRRRASKTPKILFYNAEQSFENTRIVSIVFYGVDRR